MKYFTMNNLRKNLAKTLDLPTGSCVAVIGCGGKTSAINSIAESESKNHRILISPTTAIYKPKKSFDKDEILNHKPQIGIQYAGTEESGKLRSLPLEVLEKVYQNYDLTLMEADGSKGLPLKGWESYEPVVPKFTTHTLAVLLMSSLGAEISKKNVHRLNRFTELTGLAEGEKVTEAALLKMFFPNGGMLQKARGEITLLLNGVKSDEDESIDNFYKLIYNHTENMHVLVGDTHADKWYRLK